MDKYCAVIGQKLFTYDGGIEITQYSILPKGGVRRNVKMASDGRPVNNFYAMSNYDDKWFFVTGGESLRGKLNATIYYSIKTNTWKDGKALNIGRSHHSSCVQKDKLYVVGGYSLKQGSGFLNSIEYLNTKGVINNIPSKWTILTFNEKEFPPR